MIKYTHLIPLPPEIPLKLKKKFFLISSTRIRKETTVWNLKNRWMPGN